MNSILGPIKGIVSMQSVKGILCRMNEEHAGLKKKSLRQRSINNLEHQNHPHSISMTSGEWQAVSANRMVEKQTLRLLCFYRNIRIGLCFLRERKKSLVMVTRYYMYILYTHKLCVGWFLYTQSFTHTTHFSFFTVLPNGKWCLKAKNSLNCLLGMYFQKDL